MPQEHDPGCDRQHTPRQLCSVARAGVEAAAIAANAPVEFTPTDANTRPYLPPPPKVYPPISSTTARAAVLLELMPALMCVLSLALIVGLIALAIAVHRSSPFWYLTAPAILVSLLLCCIGGAGWMMVARPRVGCAMLCVQSVLVLFVLWAAALVVFSGGSSYRDDSGKVHGSGNDSGSLVPFGITFLIALAAPAASTFFLRRHMRARTVTGNESRGVDARGRVPLRSLRFPIAVEFAPALVGLLIGLQSPFAFFALSGFWIVLAVSVAPATAAVACWLASRGRGNALAILGIGASRLLMAALAVFFGLASFDAAVARAICNESAPTLSTVRCDLHLTGGFSISSAELALSPFAVAAWIAALRRRERDGDDV